MSLYSNSAMLCSEAMFLIGNSYEIEGKWDPALAEYQKVIQEYPLTNRGMDMPMYIAGYYKMKNQPLLMEDAYKKAAEHYTQLSRQYPDSTAGFNARRLAGRSYMEIKEWQKALDVFNEILQTYKGKLDLDGILMNISIIYAHELKDKEKASRALEELVKDYPNSKFIKAAEFMLKEWNQK
jgi:TolA-binding protein